MLIVILFHLCFKKKTIHLERSQKDTLIYLQETLINCRLVHAPPLEGDRHQCYHTEVGSVVEKKKKQQHRNILLSLAITRLSSIIQHSYTSISFFS